MKKLIEFTVPFPKVISGKKKGQLATMNLYPYWGRWQKTQIKNALRTRLEDWLVPENTGDVYRNGRIIFSLYRPSRLRLDADSASHINKMIIDIVTDQGYFVDDDQLQLVLNPVVVEKDRVETDIKVEVFGDKVYKNKDKK